MQTIYNCKLLKQQCHMANYIMLSVLIPGVLIQSVIKPSGHHAQCHYVKHIMLSVLMPGVIMSSVLMPSIIKPNTSCWVSVSQVSFYLVSLCPVTLCRVSCSHQFNALVLRPRMSNISKSIDQHILLIIFWNENDIQQEFWFIHRVMCPFMDPFWKKN